jgi:hypothetical protein
VTREGVDAPPTASPPAAAAADLPPVGLDVAKAAVRAWPEGRPDPPNDVIPPDAPASSPGAGRKVREAGV